MSAFLLKTKEFLDPLRRFEYLKSTKPNAVMIRATPNSVRWDEINRVQYRFQALNFHSDVLEALINNSPPLTRRERALTSPGTNIITPSNDAYNQNEIRDDKQKSNNACQEQQARVQCNRRSTSFDTFSNQDEHLSQRKGSVVQIMKDDTSDYNSDEEVFSKSETGSLEKINYNATLVQVGIEQQITDKTEIQVTSTNSVRKHDRTEERKNENNNNNVPRDETDNSNKSAISALPSNDDELYNKSKKELVMLVKQLKTELHHQKTSPRSSLKSKLSRQPLNLSLPLTSVDLKPNATPAINNETSAATNSNKNGISEEPQFSVSVLVNNLEKHVPDKNVDQLSKMQPPIRTYILTSPSGRVRALSAAFELEVEKVNSAPTSPCTSRSRKHFSPVVGKSN